MRDMRSNAKMSVPETSICTPAPAAVARQIFDAVRRAKMPRTPGSVRRESAILCTRQKARQVYSATPMPERHECTLRCANAPRRALKRVDVTRCKRDAKV
jgi:hypothetical protein